jgi:hypothetical protein
VIPDFALLQGLAHAQNRRQAGRLGGGEFLGHHRIAFTIEGATLGMADDDIGTTKILEHGRRHFAGVGTLGMLAHVLRAPGDGRTGQFGLGLRQIGERHAHRHAGLDIAHAGQHAGQQASFSARLPCIFQLPATSLRRMGSPSKKTAYGKEEGLPGQSSARAKTRASWSSPEYPTPEES